MISTWAKTLPTATEGCQLCNELDLETQRAESRGGGVLWPRQAKGLGQHCKLQWGPGWRPEKLGS